MFVGIGKPPCEGFDSLRATVQQVDTTLQLPPLIYSELGGDPSADDYPSGSAYVDDGIQEGWITVKNSVEKTPKIKQIISDAEKIIKEESNHPKTIKVEEDVTLIGAAAQEFVQNESVYVNIHTNDEAVAKAANICLPEHGFYDIRAFYTPPSEAERIMTNPDNLKPTRD